MEKRTPEITSGIRQVIQQIADRYTIAPVYRVRVGCLYMLKGSSFFTVSLFLPGYSMLNVSNGAMFYPMNSGLCYGNCLSI